MNCLTVKGSALELTGLGFLALNFLVICPTGIAQPFPNGGNNISASLD